MYAALSSFRGEAVAIIWSNDAQFKLHKTHPVFNYEDFKVCPKRIPPDFVDRIYIVLSKKLCPSSVGVHSWCSERHA